MGGAIGIPEPVAGAAAARRNVNVPPPAPPAPQRRPGRPGRPRIHRRQHEQARSLLANALKVARKKRPLIPECHDPIPLPRNMSEKEREEFLSKLMATDERLLRSAFDVPVEEPMVVEPQPANPEGDGQEVDAEFVVEAILGRRVKKGRTQYHIKWEGYSEADSTWEDERNLGEGCVEMLAEFNQIWREEKLAKKRQNAPKPGPGRGWTRRRVGARIGHTKRAPRQPRPPRNERIELIQPRGLGFDNIPFGLWDDPSDDSDEFEGNVRVVAEEEFGDILRDGGRNAELIREAIIFNRMEMPAGFEEEAELDENEGAGGDELAEADEEEGGADGAEVVEEWNDEGDEADEDQEEDQNPPEPPPEPVEEGGWWRLW